MASDPQTPERPLIIPGYAHLLHGGDYNPDQWLRHPEVIDDDFRLMDLAGTNAFAVGIFSWTSYEPAEGQYDFSWLDKIMARMADAGKKVMLATPSGAKPAWMSAKYPEIRRVTKDGLREPHQGRHNHCWTSPTYREKVHAINGRLAERYAGHAALGLWHVSNEYSAACWCDRCLGRWHAWLEEKYGDLASLNEAWWTGFWSHTYTSFSEIHPRDGSLDGMQLDWRRFNTFQIVDFYRWEIVPLRQHTPGVPCTTNFMGCNADMDYSVIAREVDIVADDQYPGYDAADPDLVRNAVSVSFKDDLYRCFKPDRPWMLMESCPDWPQWRHPTRLKRPGIHRMEMLQAIGHGAEGTCYFQWRKNQGGAEKLHGAVVDHVGHENTRVFRTVAELGADYAKLGDVLGSSVEARVALVYDWDSRWGFQVTDGAPSDGYAYDRVCHDHYQPFWEAGVPVDVVGSGADLSAYALVILPQLWMLAPGVAARIAAFVEGGGTAVMTYCSGVVDATNRAWRGGWPGEGLMNVFGIWHEETDWCASDVVRSVRFPDDNPLKLGGAYHAREVFGIVHAQGAQVLGTYSDDFYAGTPALTRHTFGRGTAYYQAARMQLDFMRDFYSELVAKLEIPGALSRKPPRGVAVQRRAKPGAEFVFLENFSGAAQAVDLTGERLRDALTSEGVEELILPPNGSAVLRR
jgi:beta-galactosidase